MAFATTARYAAGRFGSSLNVWKVVESYWNLWRNTSTAPGKPMVFFPTLHESNRNVQLEREPERRRNMAMPRLACCFDQLPD